MTDGKSQTTVEVQIGHRAVWVNAGTGECIGRFGVYGIDVHHGLADQAERGECLDCTHARTGPADWLRFQRSMLEHHGVDLSKVPMPKFVENQNGQ